MKRTKYESCAKTVGMQENETGANCTGFVFCALHAVVSFQRIGFISMSQSDASLTKVWPI